MDNFLNTCSFFCDTKKYSDFLEVVINFTYFKHENMIISVLIILFIKTTVCCVVRIYKSYASVQFIISCKYMWNISIYLKFSEHDEDGDSLSSNGPINTVIVEPHIL